ncbi:lipid-A-disaccharide synthase [Nitratireductor sp. CAU 1489]|uniref:Lipid-A-disaccharide synthase n=1 Tax=Nitratireductor arenosus TaxID=2682096 RepID=A0A844QIM7_9HYPH|nr:lipid-A-disaccharide synthase [Nitratireductor arenosus]MVA97883.1 lipid-A-disaccharide synthase [Nitratireductor arenosus]
MNTNPPVRIAVVAGEESGDLLGADLVRALASSLGKEPQLVGVGGQHLAGLGLRTLFDPDEIALMGFTAVVARLPQLARRIATTARALAEARPDVLITIDSPDFSLRVAKKFRSIAPNIPIVHYVCPSVWAWRPGRAERMAAFVDHVLCVLPFEVEVLRRLGGPPATYVGHRLVHDPAVEAAADRQRAKKPAAAGEAVRLLVLPGSRRSELKRLMEPFGETVAIMTRRGLTIDLTIPTLPHLQETVATATRDWATAPKIVTAAEGKYDAFGAADAALAASGTVSLELALVGVPMVSCYKADLLFKLAYSFLTTWTGSLPNLVADYPVVPEYYDAFLRPGLVARQLERLAADTPQRAAQRAGFADITKAMATDRPAGELAAEAVKNLLYQRKTAP